MEFKAGDRVVFTSAKDHEKHPGWWPIVGTIGTVVYAGPVHSKVQWPAGTTSKDDCWTSRNSDFKPYPLQFDPVAFKRGDYVVNCETQAEADEFVFSYAGTFIPFASTAERCIRHAYWYGPHTCYMYEGGKWKSLIIGPESVGYLLCPLYKFKDLKFKEEHMSNTEKLADLERRSREVADKIKALREQPRFTLEGFLRGDLSLSFTSDRDKGIFLGWIHGKSNILWADGRFATEFFPEMSFINVSDGVLVQGSHGVCPTVVFTPHMLCEDSIDASTELKSLEAELRQIADEMAALKKEMEKPKGYTKPIVGEVYMFVSVTRRDIEVTARVWTGEPWDESCYASGNCYLTLSEAQRVADMMSYFFLVQKKAREMNGLLGYGQYAQSGGDYVLEFGNFKLAAAKSNRWVKQPPMAPVMTEECAKTLAEDPEIIASAKKAWDVK